MKKMLKNWLPLWVAITLVFTVVYVAVQQNYRLSANDPQIQYSQDIKSILEGGSAKPEDLASQQKIDFSKSLSTFIVIFDKDKKMVGSTGTIGDHVPLPPTGTFNFSNNKAIKFLEQNREEKSFTWQPEKGVRVAAVMTQYKDGYILVGRSLKEVERRINDLGLIVLGSWITTIALTFGAVYLINVKPKVKKKETE